MCHMYKREKDSLKLLRKISQDLVHNMSKIRSRMMNGFQRAQEQSKQSPNGKVMNKRRSEWGSGPSCLSEGSTKGTGRWWHSPSLQRMAVLGQPHAGLPQAWVCAHRPHGSGHPAHMMEHGLSWTVAHNALHGRRNGFPTISHSPRYYSVDRSQSDGSETSQSRSND